MSETGRVPSLADQEYEAAKVDPIARIILDALHEQDARTYNGQSGNVGSLALEAAGRIRVLLSGGDRG